MIVFNYLFSNGDAHLKNFSLIENSFLDNAAKRAYYLDYETKLNYLIEK